MLRALLKVLGAGDTLFFLSTLCKVVTCMYYTVCLHAQRRLPCFVIS